MAPVFCGVSVASVGPVAGVVVGASFLVAVVEVFVVTDLVAELPVSAVTEVKEPGSAIRTADVDTVFLVLRRAHERLVERFVLLYRCRHIFCLEMLF